METSSDLRLDSQALEAVQANPFAAMFDALVTDWVMCDLDANFGLSWQLVALIKPVVGPSLVPGISPALGLVIDCWIVPATVLEFAEVDTIVSELLTTD